MESFKKNMEWKNMRIREKYEVMVEIPYKIVFILIFCYWEPCIFKIFAWVCFAFAARKLSWTRRSVMINIPIHRVIIWIHSSVSFLFLAPISYFLFIEFRFFGKNFVAVQSLSHVWLFATPWTVALQASFSSNISWSLLKFMSTESVIAI